MFARVYAFIARHSFEWWTACLFGIYPLATIATIGLLIIRVWCDTGIFPPRTDADMKMEYLRSKSNENHDNLNSIEFMSTEEIKSMNKEEMDAAIRTWADAFFAAMPDFSKYEKTSTFFYPIHGWIAQNLSMGLILLILPCVAFLIMRYRRISRSSMLFVSVSWIGSLGIIWFSRDVWASWLFD